MQPQHCYGRPHPAGSELNCLVISVFYPAQDLRIDVRLDAIFTRCVNMALKPPADSSRPAGFFPLRIRPKSRRVRVLGWMSANCRRRRRLPMRRAVPNGIFCAPTCLAISTYYQTLRTVAAPMMEIPSIITQSGQLTFTFATLPQINSPRPPTYSRPWR